MNAASYVIWYVGFVLELMVVVHAFRRGTARRLWPLCLYMASECVASISRYSILSRYGITSPEYMYCYYYSDAILTIFLFLVLLTLFGYVFQVRTWRGIPLKAAAISYAGVAFFSYAVVHQTQARFMTHFVVEFSQNLYFVAMLAVFAILAGVITKKMPPTAEVNLVWLLAIYFCVFWGIYVSGYLQPHYSLILQFAPPLGSLGLALGSLLIVMSDDAHLRFRRN